MHVSKAVAIIATAVTTAAAYSNVPLEARNDLDLTPDDVGILFERDIFDDDLDDIELFARDFDLDLEDDGYLYGRALLDRDPDLMTLLARDFEFDPEDLDTLFIRDSGKIKSAMKSAGSKVGSSIKKGAGACFGCVDTTSTKAGKAVQMGTVKTASAAKAAAKSTGNFLKEGYSGAGAEYMAQQMRMMDPLGLSMGAYTYPSVSRGHGPAK